MKYLLLVITLIFSCSPVRRAEKLMLNNSVILINEGPWKTNFKNMVFSNVLFKFYGKDFNTCCLSKDASGTANYDWLNYDTAIYNKISNLSDSFVRRYSLGTDIEGRKVMMNFALEYRNSYELDSITGVYYMQFKKDSIQKIKF
jgi:hypothetical protein